MKGLRGYGVKEEFAHARSAKFAKDVSTLCKMSKCVSWKKKWIRTVAWRLDLDGRRDRDECAKPTIGRARNLSNGNVAVFFMVRFQEKEMRKAARRKYAEKVWQGGHYDVGPLGPTPAQAGMLLRRGWFGRLREGFVPNVEMNEVALRMS